jgi:hypothetical protein
MDLLLQIGVTVHHLPNARMLKFLFDFIDKCMNRSDFKVLNIDNDSNYFASAEESIEKKIKPHMREDNNKDKRIFLPSNCSEE